MQIYPPEIDIRPSHSQKGTSNVTTSSGDDISMNKTERAEMFLDQAEQVGKKIASKNTYFVPFTR